MGPSPFRVPDEGRRDEERAAAEREIAEYRAFTVGLRASSDRDRPRLAFAMLAAVGAVGVVAGTSLLSHRSAPLAPDPGIPEVDRQIDVRPTTPVTTYGSWDGTCEEPLDAFCLLHSVNMSRGSGDPLLVPSYQCPDYATALAAAKGQLGEVTACEPSGVQLEVDIGTCGAFRVLRFSGGFTARTMYFAPDGALAGASAASDYDEFCGHRSMSVSYGDVPSCAERIGRTLCGRGMRCGND